MALSVRRRRPMVLRVVLTAATAAFVAARDATCCDAEHKCCGRTFGVPQNLTCAAHADACCAAQCRRAVQLADVVVRVRAQK
mmetsp:Transcript_11645/g.47086  ORF Transcript_11645/g.47086 Transcript_11645/m.47086 type:complete len:82 (-) Transcript_11645:880-1125(-)